VACGWVQPPGLTLVASVRRASGPDLDLDPDPDPDPDPGPPSGPDSGPDGTLVAAEP
jgi:hypothetical protein